MTKLHIMNMVCDRCITSVRKVFEKHGYPTISVTLGEVILEGSISENDLSLIEEGLKSNGFRLIDSKAPVLVTKIKSVLINLYLKDEIPEDFKLSTFLTKKFPYDYSHLSRVFSNHEKDTIEHYVIRLRIEKAKELLSYKTKNISEVAYTLGYASAAHFSRQFKKIVGISPSDYMANPRDRKSFEDL